MPGPFGLIGSKRWWHKPRDSLSASSGGDAREGEGDSIESGECARRFAPCTTQPNRCSLPDHYWSILPLSHPFLFLKLLRPKDDQPLAETSNVTTDSFKLHFPIIFKTCILCQEFINVTI